MIRSFDPVTERFLASLSLSQRRSAQATDEISSGYRVTKPSDAPSDVVSILHIQSDLALTAQIESNLSRIKNEVDSAEAAVETAVTILDKANVLGAQALGLGQDAGTRAAIALQVDDLHKQLVGLSQLNVQGRYVFSGDDDRGPQYGLDPANLLNGVQRNFQTQQSGEIEDVLGTSFTAGETAQDLFDHRNPDDSLATDNAFAAMEQLKQGLLTNDTAQIGQAVTNLKASGSWINLKLSFYGAVQNRIGQSTAIAERYQVQWKQQLGGLRDADYAEAATDLQAATTQQNAAMAARARFAPRSLFDFLQ
jgi:flagellar hook-associated protein 3 FlgL